MSNITGMITFLIGAVVAGVSVWFLSKQHHRNEVQKHRKETERRIIAQLEQETHQRQEIEHQRKQEQQHHEETERRLLAQLEQEIHQRQETQRRLLAQLEKEKHQRQEIERHRLAQLEEISAEDYYKQGLEKGKRGNYTEATEDFTQALRLNTDFAKAYEYRGLAYSKLGENQAAIEDFQKAVDLYRQQGETENYQDALERIRKLKDSNQQPHQAATVPESHLPSWESFKGEIEGGIREIESGIGDLENSLVNFFGNHATLTPKRAPSFASKLRDLLASGKWEKADKETLKIMLKVAGREKEGWLDVASIQNFPCEDLRTIDQLWLESSNGRFGFNVQKRIWESVGGNHKAGDKIYEAFGDRVGWRVHKNWLQIDDLTYELPSDFACATSGVSDVSSQKVG